MDCLTSKFRKNLMLAIAVLAGTSALKLPAASAQNLVGNAGFETIDEKTSFVTGWGKHWSYTGDLQAITDPAQSHGGVSYVSINQNAPGASDVFTTLGGPRVSVQGSRQYKLTVWAKGKGSLSVMPYLYAGNTFLEPGGATVAPATGLMSPATSGSSTPISSPFPQPRRTARRRPSRPSSSSRCSST